MTETRKTETLRSENYAENKLAAAQRRREKSAEKHAVTIANRAAKLEKKAAKEAAINERKARTGPRGPVVTFSSKPSAFKTK